ncbi:pectinesterase inhibitor-like [Cucumis melo var. makuwa]|uniref:Pectinesterase inhibitor-like n=1 Tax=Cucumis melo var. makuwa TaxID=1194695 RepID=A0A5D3BTG4_CUCMM|nr:pectinesterase inhibitor-like [Cucumis melo var. makuwa]
MTNSSFDLRIFGSVAILVFVCSFLFSNVVSSRANTITPSNDVASSICPKTRNPSFCVDVLKSAGSTDLKVLATYTLNLTNTNAEKSLNLVKSLAATTTNPQLKNQYLSCYESYEEVVGDIEIAKSNLASGDFNGVNIATSGIMTAVDDCQDSFKQPPKDTSMLLKNGKTLNDVCSIILVISNLLL